MIGHAQAAMRHTCGKGVCLPSKISLDVDLCNIPVPYWEDE
jgi:hypothetical protein